MLSIHINDLLMYYILSIHINDLLMYYILWIIHVMGDIHKRFINVLYIMNTHKQFINFLIYL